MKSNEMKENQKQVVARMKLRAANEESLKRKSLCLRNVCHAANKEYSQV